MSESVKAREIALAEERRVMREAGRRAEVEGARLSLLRNKYNGEMHPPHTWEGLLSVSVCMTKEDHRLLRAIALKRAKKTGQPVSLSGVVVELIERHRPELLKEAGAGFKREMEKKK